MVVDRETRDNNKNIQKNLLPKDILLTPYLQYQEQNDLHLSNSQALQFFYENYSTRINQNRNDSQKT